MIIAKKIFIQYLVIYNFAFLISCSTPTSNQTIENNLKSDNYKNFFSQIYRVSFKYPQDWQLNITEEKVNYLNNQQFFTIENIFKSDSYSFDKIIEKYPGWSVKDIKIESLPAKLLRLDDKSILIAKYPKAYSYTLANQEIEYFTLSTNKNNMENIINSISFAYDPKQFFKSVIDLIKNYSIMKDRADIKKFSDNKDKEAENIDQSNLYSSLKSSFKEINDNHSSIWPNEVVNSFLKSEEKGLGIDFLISENKNVIFTVFPDSPADKVGVKVGDIITGQEEVNNITKLSVLRDNTNLTFNIQKDIFNTNIEPTVKMIENNYAYLELPSSTADYAVNKLPNIIQEKIRNLDTNNDIKGWIVDLRRNTGGSTYPMLNAIGPIVGEGVIGGRKNSSGKVYIWSYQDGKVFLDKEIFSQLNIQAYKLKKDLPPVTILTSSVTSSAGEGVAIAFKNRTKTYFIGEKTNGQTTGNRTFVLADGGWLNLSDSVNIDRNKNEYFQALQPDKFIQTDWSLFYKPESDKLIIESLNWLKTQN